MLRKRERITDRSRRETEETRLIEVMIDCRIGSEEWIKAKAALDEYYRRTECTGSGFNPDARL